MKYFDILDIALSKGTNCTKISCSSNADLLSDHSATELHFNLPLHKKAPRQKMFRKGTNLDVFTDCLPEKVNPDHDITTPDLIDSETNPQCRPNGNTKGTIHAKATSKRFHSGCLKLQQLWPKWGLSEESGLHEGTQGIKTATREPQKTFGHICSF